MADGKWSAKQREAYMRGDGWDSSTDRPGRFNRRTETAKIAGKKGGTIAASTLTKEERQGRARRAALARVHVAGLPSSKVKFGLVIDTAHLELVKGALIRAANDVVTGVWEMGLPDMSQERGEPCKVGVMQQLKRYANRVETLGKRRLMRMEKELAALGKAPEVVVSAVVEELGRKWAEAREEEDAVQGEAEAVRSGESGRAGSGTVGGIAAQGSVDERFGRECGADTSTTDPVVPTAGG